MPPPRPARGRRLAVAALGGAGGSFESAARRERGAVRPLTPTPTPTRSAPRSALPRPAMGNAESVLRGATGIGKCGSARPFSPRPSGTGRTRPDRSPGAGGAASLRCGFGGEKQGSPCGVPRGGGGGGCGSGIGDKRSDVHGGGR